jgi:hypothetical protein
MKAPSFFVQIVTCHMSQEPISVSAFYSSTKAYDEDGN